MRKTSETRNSSWVRNVRTLTVVAINAGEHRFPAFTSLCSVRARSVNNNNNMYSFYMLNK